MLANPFKFGTVVDDPYFTDRETEIDRISSFINSANHLLLISPRRYGKTSLARKVLKTSGRKYIYLDLQLVLSPEDFAAQLLKRIYRLFPAQKLKGFIKSFRIIPSIILNPVTGETEIAFKSGSPDITPLEDTLNLIEKLGTEEKRLIVVLDEFQEIFRIGSGLDLRLRGIIQIHKNVNYIFMGSSESLVREIFERKNSPFYHFAALMTLSKIEKEKFSLFLEGKFKKLTKQFKLISEEILQLTGSHPYYTQQLAFNVWELIYRSYKGTDLTEKAVAEIVSTHDNDFERLWNTLNGTDMKILAGMAANSVSPLSEEFSVLFGTGATSTVFSALKRLTNKGILTKTSEGYSIDDPFFRRWIVLRRER